MLDFFFPLSQTKLWPYYTGTAYPSSCLLWVQRLLTLLHAYPGFRDCLPFFMPTLGSGTAYPSSCLLWVQGLLTLLPAYPGFRDCLPFFLPTLGSGTAYPSSCLLWVQGLLTLLHAYPSSCLPWVQGLLTLLHAYPGFRDCLPFFMPTLGSSPVFLVGSMFVIILLLWLVFFASFVFVGVLCPMLPVSLDCPFCFHQRLFIGMWYSHINFCASTSHTINKSSCRKDHTLYKPDLIYIPQISVTRGREESVCAIELQKPENHIN